MACALTTGRKIPCKSAFGGIKEVLFADFGGLTGVTLTSGIVTAIAGSVSWYKYDVKGNSSLETAMTSSRDNGTTFYTQTINLTLPYLDAETQQELQLLALGRPYAVTGAAAGDLSGFTMVFEGMEETAPYFVASGLIVPEAGQITPN